RPARRRLLKRPRVNRGNHGVVTPLVDHRSTRYSARYQPMVNKAGATMDATAPREKAFLLARPEQRLLEAIARRVPARVLPDHLTALALLAAAGFAVFGAFG